MKCQKDSKAYQVYDLTAINNQQHQISRYQQLVNLLKTQIHHLQNTISSLTCTIRLFESAASNLASILKVGPFPPLDYLKEADYIKIYLEQIQRKVIDVFSKEIEEKRDSASKERVVKVQCPVFVQKVVERQVERIVIKEIEKPVYIQRVVEVPIFVQKKNNSNICIICSRPTKEM